MPVGHRESTCFAREFRLLAASTTRKRPASTVRRVVCISGQYLPSPGDRVLHPRAIRLAADPQFEVLRAIVVAPAVAVMHLFAWEEISPQHVLHHQDVFQHIPAVSNAAGMPNPTAVDVALLVDVPGGVALPVWVLAAPVLNARKTASTSFGLGPDEGAATGARAFGGDSAARWTITVLAGGLELAAAGGAVLHCGQCPIPSVTYGVTASVT